MTDPAPTDEDLERPELRISATQITTGVVASTASALLGSTLGIAGTLIGAAVGAVAYSVVATLYGHWLAATRHRLRLARLERHLDDAAFAHTLSGADTSPAAGAPADGDASPDAAVQFEVAAISDRAARTGVSGESQSGSAGRSAQDFASDAIDAGTGLLTAVGTRKPAQPAQPRRPRAPRLPGSPHWRSVLAGSVGSAVAFALALLVVTGLESATGKPLSGGTAGGLSVLGGATPVQPDASPATTHITIVQTSTETETSVVTSTDVGKSTDAETPVKSSESTSGPSVEDATPAETSTVTPPVETTPTTESTADASASGETAPSDPAVHDEDVATEGASANGSSASSAVADGAVGHVGGAVGEGGVINSLE